MSQLQSPETSLPATPIVTAAAPPAPVPTPPSALDTTRLGILLMCAICLIFAVQDSFSRVLGAEYPPLMIVMIRYWVFFVFVIALVARQPGGLRRAVLTRRPITQFLRGAILVIESYIMVEAFVRLGLVNTHAVFTVSPLLVAALSGPILGEKVGWRRWVAIGIGFVGILIVLKPGSGVISVESLLPLIAALLFALYGLLTRHVARDDPSMISFFWTGVSGAITITLLGIWQWEWLRPEDWGLMAGLCVLGILSHYLLIRAYELAEASALQPFAYTQLVWATILGVVFFHDTLSPNVLVGAGVIVAAGLFTLWRTRVKSAAASPAAKPGR